MLIRTPKDLGRLILLARKGYGLSQGELARRVGTTQKWISLVENGRPGAQLDLVLRTLAVLRVSLQASFPEKKGESGESEPDSLIDQVANRGKRGAR